MSYLPDIAIPPGETIKDILETEEMSQKELAQRIGLSEKHLSSIMKGDSPITLETAIKLEKVIDGSANFWMNLENGYQTNKARLKEVEKLKNEVEKAKLFKCYNELVANSFVKKVVGKGKKLKDVWEQKTKNLLNFFKVPSLDYVSSLYPEVHCRNAKDGLNKESLMAWIRCGDIRSTELKLEKFDRKKLRSYIPEFKKLTNCPSEFDKKLQDLCASVGVAVVFVPYFKKTHINGAVRWMRKNKHPLIQLNTKGSVSDRFWFTFFHELGHIFLHKKDDRFLERKNIAIDNKKEKEADDFAEENLISKNDFNEFIKNKDFSSNAISKKSQKWQVHESIIAGRLAKMSIIDWHEFNNYKISLRFNP